MDCVIANKIVQEMEEMGNNTARKGERGSYKAYMYSKEEQLRIACYAVDHGPLAAALNYMYTVMIGHPTLLPQEFDKSKMTSNAF